VGGAEGVAGEREDPRLPRGVHLGQRIVRQTRLRARLNRSQAQTQVAAPAVLHRRDFHGENFQGLMNSIYVYTCLIRTSAIEKISLTCSGLSPKAMPFAKLDLRQAIVLLLDNCIFEP